MKISCAELEELIEYKMRVKSVEKYINTEKYADKEVIYALLGIEVKKEKEEE